MKRSWSIFLIAGVVLVTTGIWLFTSGKEFTRLQLGGLVVLMLVIAFAVFIGIHQLSCERKREPVEDELSRKVLQKAAAISYYISLYLWVGMIYFIKDRVRPDIEEILGVGILGMAIGKVEQHSLSGQRKTCIA